MCVYYNNHAIILKTDICVLKFIQTPTVIGIRLNPYFASKETQIIKNYWLYIHKYTPILSLNNFWPALTVSPSSTYRSSITPAPGEGTGTDVCRKCKI